MTNRRAFLPLVLIASVSLFADDKSPKTDHHTDRHQEAQKKSAAGPKANSGLCDKLFRFSCAPGEYDDGTGVARSKSLVSDKMEEIKRDESKAYAERFKTELAKTPRLRDAAIAAFELNDSPDCEERDGESDEAAAKARREKCDKTLAEALAELSVDRLFSGPDLSAFAPMGSRVGGLRGLDYLLNNPAFKRVENEVGTKIREKLVDKKSASAIETEIFPEVRDSLVALIDKLVMNPQDKKKMMKKVKAIEFAGTDCTKLSGGQEASVIGSLIPNAFYSPLENTFRYCNGYLMQSTSRFQIVHVIAHELSHSIDPCQIASDFEGSAVAYTNPADLEDCEKEYPLSGIIGCLRNEESVGAKRRSPEKDPLLGGYGGGYPIPPIDLNPKPPGPTPKSPEEKSKHFPGDGHDHGPAAALAYRGYGLANPNSPFCSEEDQVTEALADRIADELLPDYIEKHHANLTEEQKRIGYSNVYRGACPRKGSAYELPGGHDVHPTVENRVDRSLLVHPKVRKQMGCQEAPPEGRRFCPLEAAEVPKVTKKKDAPAKKIENFRINPKGGNW